KNFEVQIALGAIYIGLGRVDQAIRRFELAVQLNPDDADVHYNLGVSFHIKGVLIRAEISYRQALRIDPQHEEAHRNRDVVLAQLGRTKDRVPDPNRQSVPSPKHCTTLDYQMADLERRGKDLFARGEALQLRIDGHNMRKPSPLTPQSLIDAYNTKAA